MKNKNVYCQCILEFIDIKYKLLEMSLNDFCVSFMKYFFFRFKR